MSATTPPTVCSAVTPSSVEGGVVVVPSPLAVVEFPLVSGLVVVDGGGPEVLTAAIPKERAEVEAAVGTAS